MKLIQLPVNGNQTKVTGTFTFGAALVGDAILSVAYTDPKKLPAFSSTLVPNEGDNIPPTVEALDLAVLGVTSTGRVVYAFRSGNRKPNSQEWDGTSSFYAAVGAPSTLREPGHSIVVQTTQPGPPGPQGATGPQGPPGPPGAAGGDAEVDDATIDRIAARVWTVPPQGDLVNLSGINMGTAAQEVTAYPWSQRQDFLQLVIRRIDEAVLNLVEGGYTPQAK